MKKILRFLYLLYEYLIAFPIFAVATILAALVTLITCAFGSVNFWGYWPAHIWARFTCMVFLMRVKVTGREYIDPKQSYVFVCNHQGAYDIWAIYGYLNHNFKWLMKKSLEKIPLVGYTCRVCGNIFVDNSKPSTVRQTMEDAEKRLAGGMSVVVFPEGSRTLDGRMHGFRRGAFALAVEFGLPVVPITIDGAFRVMPRTAWLPRPGHIILTIHEPIVPKEGERHDLASLMTASSYAIASSLPENQRPR